MSQGDIILFTGPSLPRPCDVEDRLPIRRLGPAAQGDLLKAALARPRAIILLDGYFEALPAVYHKEILWALSQGIPVYGAASIGALRACELGSFGMIGVGEIFDAFAQFRLEADDEVALIHAPEEVGFANLSEPLVNIRWTLDAAVAAQVVERQLADALVAAARRRFYPDRSFVSLLEDCAVLDPAAADRLELWLPEGRIDQKNRDALACMQRVESDWLNDTLPDAPAFEFRHTDAFETLLTGVLSHNPINDPEVLIRCKTASGDRFDALRLAAEIDALALALDQHSGQPVPGEDLVRAVSEFRQQHRLLDQQALQHWLSRNGVDIDALSRKLEESARIARARQQIEPHLNDRMRDLLVFARGASQPGDKG